MKTEKLSKLKRAIVAGSFIAGSFFVLTAFSTFTPTSSNTVGVDNVMTSDISTGNLGANVLDLSAITALGDTTKKKAASCEKSCSSSCTDKKKDGATAEKKKAETPKK